MVSVHITDRNKLGTVRRLRVVGRLGLKIKRDKCSVTENLTFTERLVRTITNTAPRRVIATVLLGLTICGSSNEGCLNWMNRVTHLDTSLNISQGVVIVYAEVKGSSLSTPGLINCATDTHPWHSYKDWF